MSSGESQAVAPLKRKRGRPKGSKNKPKVTVAPPRKPGRPRKRAAYVEAEIAGLRIETIPISKIDLQDSSFKFRVNLRIGNLAESIGQDGQQFPVVLRRKPGGKLQVISGFRRLAAIDKLGWETVKAVIRTDIDDNAEACKVSILENEIRQTYNDLDRAYAILAYRGMGKSDGEIEDIFKVGQRQRQRLEELTTLPAQLRNAVADERVSATNAVRLMQHVRKYDDYPEEKLKRWIDWIVENQATLAFLTAAIKEEEAGEKKGKPVEFFVPREKGGKKSLRIRPIAIDDSLNTRQKQQLVKDLKAVIAFVEGL